MISRDGSRRALAAAIALTVAFGVWLRFEGLNRKMYWYDEIATFLVLSGHTQSDVSALYDGRPIHVSDFRVFQRPLRIDPGGERAVVGAHLSEDPHNTPIYLWLAWAAARTPLGGTGPRAVSAVSSVAAIGAIALLAFRLFRDVWIAGLAAALASVSPVHFRYAQEARSYAVWSLAIAGTGLLLLRAIERRDWTSWMTYAVAAALAFYVHIFSALVVAAHATFVVWSMARDAGGRGAWRRPVTAFVTAAVLSVPWVVVIALHRAAAERETAWTHQAFPLSDRAHRWVGIVTSVFVQSGAEGGLFGGSRAPAILAVRVALSLAVWGLVVLCAREILRVRSRAPAAMFVGLLAVVPAAALVVPDLIWGGRLSMVPRYTGPLWIALELCVAAGIVLAARRSGRPVWLLAVAAAVLAAGAVSSWASSRMSTWWDTNASDLRTMAAASARIQDGSTVLSDVDPVQLLVFARTLKDGVTLRLFAAGSAPGALPASPVFLFSPSAALSEAAARARPGWERCVQGDEVDLWCEAR